METILRLKVSELDLNILNSIKSLFKKNEEIEIKVSSKPLRVLKKETQEECNARIDKAIEYVENGGELIHFTGEQFLEYAKKLEKK